jgi:outer membrane receptor protein involved in Fe transport
MCALGLALFVGHARAQEPPVVLVTGVVFDAQTHAPLAGLEVRAGSAVCTTSSDGAFRLELPPGTHSLLIGGPGYPASSTQPFTLSAGQHVEILVDLSSKGDPPVIDIEGDSSATASSIDTAEKLAESLIVGTVLHAEKKEPVKDVRVFVRGLPVEGRSDARGAFSVRVPVGKHSISFVHPEFSSLTQNDIEVVEGKEAEVTVELAPLGVELEEMVITEPKIEGSSVDLLSERKDSSTVSDIIGAEQMSKAGDSDAAAALRRVTGITVVGGKYVYVRGLGERYSATLLNGASLPSPEPDRRVVPLDMFPVGMLESMVIQKTYSPDMPGEFGGGVVMLRTRAYPDELSGKLELSLGYSQGTTFERGLRSADSGKTDWLGIDGGHRDLPRAVASATRDRALVLANRFRKEGFTEEELTELSRAMPNDWKVRSDLVRPDLKLSLEVGDSYVLGPVKLGFMASGLYDNAWDHENSVRKDYTLGAGGELTLGNDYRYDSLTNTITLAGILTAGIELGKDHLIKSNTIIDRITDDEVRQYEGTSIDLSADAIRATKIDWTERQLVTQQVIGHHAFPYLSDLSLDWRYTYSRARQDMPNRREYVYHYNSADDAFHISTRDDALTRQWTTVQDDTQDFGADLLMPFVQWTKEKGSAKLGAAMMTKDREVDTRRFNLKDRGNLIAQNPELSLLPPEQILTQERMGTEGFLLNEFTRANDNSKAAQDIYALYALADVPLGLSFRIAGGARFERSQTKVTTYALFDAEAEPQVANPKNDDILPAATLSYSFLEDMVLRVGYSRTVNRPDFRELSTTCVSDVIGSGDICGEPTLKRAAIDNYDLRYEWYLSKDESIAVSGFYKRFEDPIETIVRNGTGVGFSFVNAVAAKNLGLELEARKNFGFIADPLADFFVSGNLTWVYSRVELPDEGAQTSRKRALQGQSPYVINAQLGYDNADWGTSIAALYNVFGPRIDAVGIHGSPDTYEQPFHQLDLVVKQSLPKGIKLTLKAKNLLDLPAETTQGGKITEKTSKGRIVSLAAAWTF